MSRDDPFEGLSPFGYLAFVVEHEDGSIEARTVDERRDTVTDDTGVLLVRAPQANFLDLSSFGRDLRSNLTLILNRGAYTLDQVQVALDQRPNYELVARVPEE